jgi:hypothetical protein
LTPRGFRVGSAPLHPHQPGLGGRIGCRYRRCWGRSQVQHRCALRPRQPD